MTKTEYVVLTDAKGHNAIARSRTRDGNLTYQTIVPEAGNDSNLVRRIVDLLNADEDAKEQKTAESEVTQQNQPPEGQLPSDIYREAVDRIEQMGDEWPKAKSQNTGIFPIWS